MRWYLRTSALASLLIPSAVTSAQATQVAAASAFVPGGQELFAQDFAGARIGTIPRGIQLLSGKVDAVSMNGVIMLRATESSELLVTLPNGLVLPQNFTIELDIIPKGCCPPPDLTIEGTRTMTQDIGSAHLQLLTDADHGSWYVIGGATDNQEFEIPGTVRATLPGVLTRVGVRVAGGNITMYLNGTALAPSVQAWFVRGSVLRITLGGLTDDGGNIHPVYLARIRVATGAPATVATALPVATPTATITPSSTTQTTQATPASAGAMASGPVSGTNPAGAAALTPYAAPASRTITLNPQAAAGILLVQHTITMPSMTTSGAFGSIAPRTTLLAGVTAAGAFGIPIQRTIPLPARTAAGIATAATASTAPTARTIALSTVSASGVFHVANSREIKLNQITAAGLSGSIAARSIRLASITAIGGVGVVAPRTIKLAGWTASGTAKTP